LDLSRTLAAPITHTDIDTQTNAAANAELFGDADFRWNIAGFSVSFNAAPTAAVTVEVLDGSTVKDRFLLPAAAQGPLVVPYGTHPIQCTPGNSARVTASAAGAAVGCTVVVKAFKTAP
jgi:hypothetical protein